MGTAEITRILSCYLSLMWLVHRWGSPTVCNRFKLLCKELSYAIGWGNCASRIPVELSVVNLARLPACRKGARGTTTTAQSISPSASSCASSIRHCLNRKHVGQIRFQQGPEGGSLPVLPDRRAQRRHKVNDPSPTDGVSRQRRSVNDSSHTRFP